MKTPRGQLPGWLRPASRGLTRRAGAWSGGGGVVGRAGAWSAAAGGACRPGRAFRDDGPPPPSWLRPGAHAMHWRRAALAGTRLARGANRSGGAAFRYRRGWARRGAEASSLFLRRRVGPEPHQAEAPKRQERTVPRAVVRPKDPVTLVKNTGVVSQSP